MPRRRTTRKPPTGKPRAPPGDEGQGLSKEDKLLKLQTYLEDFDREVESRISAMEERAKKMSDEIGHMLRCENMKFPKSVKEMKYSDFFAMGGSTDTVLAAATKATLDAAEIPMEPTVSSVHSTSKRKPPLPRRPQEFDTISEETDGTDGEPATTKPQRQRRKKTVMAPPSTATLGSVRQSARIGRNRQFIKAMDTPMVTPKFDPRLYTTPGFNSRVPKKREKTITTCYTYSYSEATGSPVRKDNVAAVVVNDGEVMMVDNATGLPMRLPVEKMSEAQRVKINELKAFIQNLQGLTNHK